MTRLSAESRRQRLLRKFHNSGKEGHWTRPFDDFSATVRERLLRMASVQEEELPVLSCFRDTENWVLLTTDRLIIHRPDDVLYLPWSDIEDATVDGHLMNAAPLFPAGKLTLSRLKLVLRRGGTVEVELEAGAAFIGFWNTMRTVAALSRA